MDKALGILRKLRDVAIEEFGDLLHDVRIVGLRRLEARIMMHGRLIIRYPREDEYSFHIELCGRIYRIDTAPHHRHLRSFPRHIYYGSEDNVVENHITSLELPPEENFRRVMDWVKNTLLPACSSPQTSGSA